MFNYNPFAFSPYLRCLFRDVVFVALLSVTSAQACIVERPRGQTVVLESFVSMRALLPAEYHVTAGDLLAVFVPKLAKVAIIDGNNKASDVVQALDVKRYRELSAQGRGRVPPEVGMIEMKGQQWLYFGAARPGLVYIDLRAPEGRALIRVNIEPQKNVPRGKIVTLTEAQQDKSQSLTMFDTLELELPGLPGDAWTTSISAGTVKIHSLVAVAPTAVDTRARVRIRLELLLQENEQSLEVKRGGNSWHYTLLPMAMPAC